MNKLPISRFWQAGQAYCQEHSIADQDRIVRPGTLQWSAWETYLAQNFDLVPWMFRERRKEVTVPCQDPRTFDVWMRANPDAKPAPPKKEKVRRA